MARDFDGVDDMVDVGDVAVLDVTRITLAAWCKPDVDDDLIVARRNRTTVVNYQFGIFGVLATDAYFFDVLVGGVNNRLEVNNQLSVGSWQHIAASYDGANQRLYKNGVEVGSRAQTGDMDISNSLEFRIGGGDIAGFQFDGKIASVQVWNVALSAAEIASAMRGRTVRPGSRVGWWELFGSASPEPDWSGNNNAGTVTGVTQADHAPVGPMFGFDLGWMGAFAAAAAFGPDEDFLDLHSRLHVPHWREPHVTVYS